MPAPLLQIKRGNAGVAGTVPALRPGEPAISLNNFDFFIGIDTSVANNKFFGSHRYWTRENGTNALNLNLVDKDGTNKISIKSPDTLVGTGTYTLPDPNTIVDGYFLRVTTGGALSWSNDLDASGSTLTNTSLSGVTTITGYVNATGAQINSGIVTVTDLYVDATRVLYNDGAGITLAGIQTIDATTKTTLETILAFDPNNFTTLNVTGIATVGGLIDGNGGLDITGHSELDNLNVSGVSTFTDLADFNGGATIDNLRLGVTADNEIDTASGNLILDSAAGTVEVQDNLTVSGISTFTGAVIANGAVTLGDASGDAITVKGTATFEQPIVGTISTATRSTLVDTTTAPAGTFYPGLFVNSTGTASTAVYVDAGISYVSNTDTLTLTGDLAVNGGDLTSSAATFNLINANATTVNAFQAATNVVVGAATGITTVRNGLAVGGDLRVNGNDIQASDGNTNITLTSNTLTTFAGDIRVNGNDIQASDGNVNITMTSNTLTEVKGDLKVTGNDIQSSTATALSLSGANVTVAGDLTVGGSDIKASDGTTALTLANATGAVTAASDLTVEGNLYVSGNTTQVNTAALTVEDRTIDLGIVNGAAPASATTWDLGILFNYNSSGAKKSAVIWEHADTRFKFASVLGADTNGTDNNTPQLSVTTFAPIEIGALWVTDCAGTSQVINCVGTERFLENITVDAGTF